jgi:hypothetical protein
MTQDMLACVLEVATAAIMHKVALTSGEYVYCLVCLESARLVNMVKGQPVIASDMQPVILACDEHACFITVQHLSLL